MKSSGRGSRRKTTAIRFLTWKDMAERKNEVMDMVAQVVSWAKAGGTNRFVRLPMSLIRPRACDPSEPNDEMRTQQKYRSSYGSLGAVSGWRRSIHVVQPPREPGGGVERIWQTSQHRKGLPDRRS